MGAKIGGGAPRGVGYCSHIIAHRLGGMRVIVCTFGPKH